MVDPGRSWWGDGVRERGMGRDDVVASNPERPLPPVSLVNPRPAGGGAFERPPPLRFFEDSENPPYPPSFPQLL